MLFHIESYFRLKKCHLWYILSHQLFNSIRSAVIHQVENTLITTIMLINSSVITTTIQWNASETEWNNVLNAIQYHTSHPTLISMQRHIDATSMHMPHTHKDQATFLAQCGKLNHHWIFLSLLKSAIYARILLWMPPKLHSSSKSECSKAYLARI